MSDKKVQIDCRVNEEIKQYVEMNIKNPVLEATCVLNSRDSLFNQRTVTVSLLFKGFLNGCVEKLLDR